MTVLKEDLKRLKALYPFRDLKYVYGAAGQPSQVLLDVEGLLDGPSRKLVAQKVLERLDSEVSFEGKRRKVRSVIQLQARHLAVAVRGEREYRTYRFKW